MRFKLGLPAGVSGNSKAMEQLQMYNLLLGAALAALFSVLFVWASPGWFVKIFTYQADVREIFPIPTIFVVISLILLSAPFHEGAHALLADRKQVLVGFAPKALIFYVAPYGVYPKWRAVAMVLLPFLLFTLIPFLVAVFTSDQVTRAWTLVLSVSHSLGCGGDIWVGSQILKIRSPWVRYGDFSTNGAGWAAAARPN